MPKQGRDLSAWSTLKTTEFPAEPENTTVILPVGSMEQHGPHLPVGVDAMLVGAVAERIPTHLPPECPALVLPVLWVSLADHHMSFPGTLTLDFATFRAVLRGILLSLARQGFRRVLLLNGHGGNVAALSIIVDELSADLSMPMACTTYWVAAAAEFGSILEGQRNLLHACEAETSMVLALAPELVDLATLAGLAIPRDGLADPHGVHRRRPIELWSRSGVVGTPDMASAAKGHRLLDSAASRLARLVAGGNIWAAGDGGQPGEGSTIAIGREG